ncbi:MAG: DNA-binding protein WhiA [Eubacteriales bacterium]|nr:DNA-binding protein WhiA [Eubacteriales bacterium]
MSSFSQQVKDELNQVVARSRACQLIELAVALVFANRQTADEIIITTSNPGFAGLLVRLLIERYHRDPELISGRETISVIIAPGDFVAEIRADILAELGTDFLVAPFKPNPERTRSCIQAALRSAILACGSMRDPHQAYHLEFSVRRKDVARWLVELLAAIDIRANEISRPGHDVVYIKEGQHISDVLLQSGAHQSLLDFESLRVEKEMRNSVNRVVNCDNANSTRLANTSARQLELLHHLEQAGLFSTLPEELAIAAQARLDNPDLSLKELGETLNPPLGKSGMNHRLKKLEQLAREKLEKEPIPHA